MAAYLGYNLRMIVADQLWFITRIREEEERNASMRFV